MFGIPGVKLIRHEQRDVRHRVGHVEEKRLVLLGE